MLDRLTRSIAVLGVTVIAFAHDRGRLRQLRSPPRPSGPPRRFLGIIPTMATSIITCPSCGKRNRIRPNPEGVPRCAACHTLLPWLVEADSATFDQELQASVPVVIDFWAPWCGPCHMVSPALERLAQAHAGRLKVVKLNIDTAQEIASRYGVRGIPLLVLVRDGNEVDRLVGAMPEPQLQAWIAQHLGADVNAPA
jgi:thioredoxin 2